MKKIFLAIYEEITLAQIFSARTILSSDCPAHIKQLLPLLPERINNLRTSDKITLYKILLELSTTQVSQEFHFGGIPFIFQPKLYPHVALKLL